MGANYEARACEKVAFCLMIQYIFQWILWDYFLQIFNGVVSRGVRNRTPEPKIHMIIAVLTEIKLISQKTGVVSSLGAGVSHPKRKLYLVSDWHCFGSMAGLRKVFRIALWDCLTPVQKLGVVTAQPDCA